MAWGLEEQLGSAPLGIYFGRALEIQPWSIMKSS